MATAIMIGCLVALAGVVGGTWWKLRTEDKKREVEERKYWEMMMRAHRDRLAEEHKLLLARAREKAWKGKQVEKKEDKRPVAEVMPIAPYQRDGGT